LHHQSIITLPDGFIINIRSISLVIATLLIASLLLRLTIRRIFNFFDEPEERIFYSKIYSWTIYGVAIFVILHHFGVSLGNITLFIGLLATGLAFAVRDVLLSFFGWMILLRKKPFRIGDYIRIGDDEGKVIHIGTFYVLLDNTPMQPEDYIRVPNRLFLEKSIANLGKTVFQESIRFQLYQMPPNSAQLLSRLAINIESISVHKRTPHLFIDIQNEKLVLIVEYLVTFEERQNYKSKVIQMVFDILGEWVVVPRI
ncbi:MAG: mechanosensitive ion channel family protein, partial [Bacteroidota bacterium]